uniref:Uncharacterized protein n=1 Tax=Oryza punctata TaxID=4537 RepID=A0A0E0KNH0_ORYPU
MITRNLNKLQINKTRIRQEVIKFIGQKPT